MRTPIEKWEIDTLRACIVRAFVVCTFGVMLASASYGDAASDRKAAADRLASELTRLQLHKIYVADFPDPVIGRIDKGCYFASVFSTYLASGNQGFVVVNRIEGQKLLTKAEIASPDLKQPDTSPQIGAATGTDGVVMGVFTQDGTSITVEISLRESATGKELFHVQHKEQSTGEYEALFPAAADSSGTIYYFAGLDGIGVAKSSVCPSPTHDLTDEEKKNQGTVLMSAVFTPDGKLDQTRLVRGLEPALDQAAMDAIKNWKADPAKDAAGNSVPVRQMVTTSFNLSATSCASASGSRSADEGTWANVLRSSF
jgi:TonB family protein